MNDEAGPGSRQDARSTAVLALTFYLGEQRFGLDCRQVQEVVPWAALRSLPGAPPAVAGLLNFRGALVPVIDLCELAIGRASRDALSTRIILVSNGVAGGRTETLGLLAEKASETARLRDSDFLPLETPVKAAPFLGRMACDEQGVLQLVNVEGLLPEDVREALFEAGRS